MRKALLVGPLTVALAAVLPVVAFAVPVSYRGLDCDALGSASALVWSPRSNLAELRCDNIGSSGQDGVSVALPASTDAWTCVFGPMPDGMVASEQMELSLYESAGGGTPAGGTVRWHTVAGRVQCTFECPGATEYIVRVWNGGALVFSGSFVSPPVVELPPGVAVCEPGSSVGVSVNEAVVSNTRQRVSDLENVLKAIGLLTCNARVLEGDRFSIAAVGAGTSAALARVEMRATCTTPGSGGGGGGGFSVARHAPKVGIGISVPTATLGVSVNDGSVLSTPSPGVTRVALGAGMANWDATFADLSRPSASLHCWGMDFAPIPGASFAGGAQLECLVPSSWTTGPDTTRVVVAADGSGTGLAFSVMHGNGSQIKLYRVAAHSGLSIVPLADGTSLATLAVSMNGPPTAFHVVNEGGEVLIRCPLPPGTVFFSGGTMYPCDSLEVSVAGPGDDDDCDGISACRLAGEALDQLDVTQCASLRQDQFVKAGGVGICATGDATLQRLGGDILVHGMSVLGSDGASPGGAGGALRAKLKEFFQTGDKPTAQQFSALIDRRLSPGTGPPEVSTLDAIYAHGTGGSFRTSVRVHAIHMGEGRLFAQLSDGTVCEPEECDDDGDGFMDFRGTSGGFGAITSVSYRRDSPWTECFEVGFGSSVAVTVRGDDHDILGLRVWRNRGGEHLGTEAPPVSALRLNGLPPGIPVTGLEGVCVLELEGIEVHTAGTGIEANGPGSSIGGFPVLATWSALADSSDADCDDDDPDEPGFTLLSKGGYHPVVIDKRFPPPSPGGPAHRGVAFTANLEPAMIASDSAGFEIVMGGTIGGVLEPRFAVLGGATSGASRKYKGQMTALQSNPLYVECFSGGVLTASFLQTDSVSFSRAPGVVTWVQDYGGDGRVAFVLTGFAPGTVVHPPGGGPDEDCDGAVISTTTGVFNPLAWTKLCAVSLWGLPPGIPLTGVRLAAIPFQDPSLAVDPGAAGRAFALTRPWPNPARGALRASFSLPSAARVRAQVYDVGGRAVATLADARFAAGEHTLAWDGCLAGGAPAPAGLYFLRVTRDGHDARVARFTQLR